MKWYQKILPWLTFIGGSLLTYLMLRSEIGNTYNVTAKVKNKKSTVTDNELHTTFDFEKIEEIKPKKVRKFKIFNRENKLFKRKNRKNGIFNKQS